MTHTRHLPSPDSLLGTRVGDINIERLLSQSENSLIYLGTQEGIGRRAVVKLLPSSGEQNQGSALEMLKNAAPLGKLRHANIVTIYNAGLHQETYPYLIMEYISGGSLYSLLSRRGPMKADRALGLIQQIAHALEEVHRLGMLHHNLSLHNILIENLAGSNQELAKLINFAQVRPYDKDPSHHLERVIYMTPEEVLGGEYKTRSEFYVCGVMLYQVLTGYMPYHGPTPEELWDEIINSSPPLLALVDPSLAMYDELQPLLEQMMAKKSRARFGDARAMRLQIGQVLQKVVVHNMRLGQGNAPSFPVINTVDKLPALPRSTTDRRKQKPVRAFPQPQSQAAASRLDAPRMGVPNTGAPQVNAPIIASPTIPTIAPIPKPAPPSYEDGSTSNVPELQVVLDKLKWTALHIPRLSEMLGQPYLLLAAQKPDGRFPGSLVRSLESVVGASSGQDMTFLVLPLPPKASQWMPWLSARARQYNLSIGLAYGRQLDPHQRHPSTHTARIALQALKRAQLREIIAARHAVDALRLNTVFTELDPRGTGRYASFLHYKGMNA